MNFSKSNIVLILLIAFFVMFIVMWFMKSMNISEGMVTDIPATPGPPAATPADTQAAAAATKASDAAACQAATPATSKITSKAING